MNLVYLASSCLCIIMASLILFFSFSLSSRIRRMWFRCSIYLICSSRAAFSFACYRSLLIYFNLETSLALLRVSSIFFHVFISSCFRRAIRFASNWASLSVLHSVSQFYYLLFAFFLGDYCWSSIASSHTGQTSVSFHSYTVASLLNVGQFNVVWFHGSYILSGTLLDL